MIKKTRSDIIRRADHLRGKVIESAVIIKGGVMILRLVGGQTAVILAERDGTKEKLRLGRKDEARFHGGKQKTAAKRMLSASLGERYVRVME